MNLKKLKPVIRAIKKAKKKNYHYFLTPSTFSEYSIKHWGWSRERAGKANNTYRKLYKEGLRHGVTDKPVVRNEYKLRFTEQDELRMQARMKEDMIAFATKFAELMSRHKQKDESL